MEPLLDSTLLVEYFRKIPRAKTFINQLRTPTISIVTQAEIYEECKNANELKWADQILQHFRILPITPDISYHAVRLVKDHHLAYGLHLLDALIAATAIVHNHPLLTENVKHFRPIASLQIIAWPPLKTESSQL